MEKTEKAASSLSDTSSAEGSVNREPETSEKHSSPQRRAKHHGEPDIDHDEIEAATPGHALDVELGHEVSITTTMRTRKVWS